MAEKDIKESIVGFLADWKVSNDNSNAVWKVVGGILLAIVVFITIAIISRKAFSQWKELAELRHKQDVLEQESIRENWQLQNSKLEEEIEDARDRIKEIDAEIRVIGKDIEVLDEQWKLEKDKINALEDWDSVDRYVRDSGR